MKGKAIIGQSGGPTSVINASLVGAVEAARAASDITGIYGMRFAIEGFLQDVLVDLGAQSPATLCKLKATPSSGLGSSRHKLKEEELPRVLELLKKHDVRYFFLIGGNDTMDTIHCVEAYCRREGYELRGVGIPKTVDNDLFGTDHTPGYGSAATYVARSVAQAGLLARDMQKVDKFVVFQTVGRDAGWLAAAAALAKEEESQAPHLIYTPEKPFNRDRCLADVRALHRPTRFLLDRLRRRDEICRRHARFRNHRAGRVCQRRVRSHGRRQRGDAHPSHDFRRAQSPRRIPGAGISADVRLGPS